MIERTDADYAPWTVIEAHDRRFAVVKIFRTVLDAIARRAAGKAPAPARAPAEAGPKLLNSSVLGRTDLSKTLTQKEYDGQIEELQRGIREMEYKIYRKRIPVMVMYEGWDAAGKGGNIRRLTANMDPRGYEVIPVAAPNDTEKAHHYLWRFWNAIPKAGHVAIFDRTWYGRVLVERVEGFCPESDWRRAYREINAMERHLANSGTVLFKFWLHISKEEQLRRFKERERITHKNWKITAEDWRNRKKWENYREAVDEMLFRTSTACAPWTIVESNDKRYARVKTLKTILGRMREAL
jgi:polyphosphate kinase 2 (PPK2 family)